jgi:hypothetical protein
MLVRVKGSSAPLRRQAAPSLCRARGSTRRPAARANLVAKETCVDAGPFATSASIGRGPRWERRAGGRRAKGQPRRGGVGRRAKATRAQKGARAPYSETLAHLRRGSNTGRSTGQTTPRARLTGRLTGHRPRRARKEAQGRGDRGVRGTRARSWGSGPAVGGREMELQKRVGVGERLERSSEKRSYCREESRCGLEHRSVARQAVPPPQRDRRISDAGGCASFLRRRPQPQFLARHLSPLLKTPSLPHLLVRRETIRALRSLFFSREQACGKEDKFECIPPPARPRAQPSAPPASPSSPSFARPTAAP